MKFHVKLYIVGMICVVSGLIFGFGFIKVIGFGSIPNLYEVLLGFIPLGLIIIGLICLSLGFRFSEVDYMRSEKERLLDENEKYYQKMQNLGARK